MQTEAEGKGAGVGGWEVAAYVSKKTWASGEAGEEQKMQNHRCTASVEFFT